MAMTNHFYICISVTLTVLTLCLLRNAFLLFLRHEVISLRNQLFIDWTKMGLPFNTPAYASLRWLMNATLRFSHKLSPARIFPVYTLDKYYKGEKPDTVAKFENRLAGLESEQARNLLSDYASKLNRKIGVFFLFASISGIVFVTIILICALIRKICKHDIWRMFYDPNHYGRRAQTLAFR
jgi:hypothetical protein